MPPLLHHFFGDAVVASGILALLLNVIFPKSDEQKEAEKKSA